MLTATFGQNKPAGTPPQSRSSSPAQQRSQSPAVQNNQSFAVGAQNFFGRNRVQSPRRTFQAGNASAFQPAVCNRPGFVPRMQQQYNFVHRAFHSVRASHNSSSLLLPTHPMHHIALLSHTSLHIFLAHLMLHVQHVDCLRVVMFVVSLVVILISMLQVHHSLSSSLCQVYHTLMHLPHCLPLQSLLNR